MLFRGGNDDAAAGHSRCPDGRGNRIDVVIISNGAHYPGTDPDPAVRAANVGLYRATLDAVGAVVRSWKADHPGLRVVWQELPAMPAPGDEGYDAAGTEKYGWDAYAALNLLARSKLVGLVDTFVGDQTVAVNEYNIMAKHDQVHGCGPGPIPFHLLQLALHSAAHFGPAP